jgi:tripeptide aminopeptidase
MLVKELIDLGLTDAVMDKNGYVMATLPSNLPPKLAAALPVIGFLAHVDTSPEAPGVDVRPQLVKKYDGGDIVLSGDPTQVISPKNTPELENYLGWDLVTSDGTTLLGADDKAGVAEIMTAIEWFLMNPKILRPTIRFGFTPDEEVGMGTAHFDIKAFGASAAYTLDGGEIGEVENETFLAHMATITITGVNVHPGYAKGKLVNSQKPMGAIVDLIGAQPSPETTENREAYLHVHSTKGEVAKSVIQVLIRSFDDESTEVRKALLRRICDEVGALYPGAKIELEIAESYKNMKFFLDQHPHVFDRACQAVEDVGLKVLKKAIRGGTDGARLSERGLPTPNIFAGGHDFHSKLEFVPVRSMTKAVEVIIRLAELWSEAA